MSPRSSSDELSFQQLFSIVFVLFALLLVASAAFAWTGPTAAPPNGNVAAPVNVGTTNQIKDAGLGVNSLAVYGTALVQGMLRVGSQTFTSNTNGWLYVGDANGTPYVGQGIAMDKMWANSMICLSGDCRSQWPGGGTPGNFRLDTQYLSCNSSNCAVNIGGTTHVYQACPSGYVVTGCTPQCSSSGGVGYCGVDPSGGNGCDELCQDASSGQPCNRIYQVHAICSRVVPQ